jgi:hypothetical protein
MSWNEDIEFNFKEKWRITSILVTTENSRGFVAQLSEFS